MYILENKLKMEDRRELLVQDCAVSLVSGPSAGLCSFTVVCNNQWPAGTVIFVEGF